MLQAAVGEGGKAVLIGYGFLYVVKTGVDCPYWILLGDGHEFVNPLIGLEIPILIYSMDSPEEVNDHNPLCIPCCFHVTSVSDSLSMYLG